MAYGSVNVPGVTGPELEEVRKLAQNAKDTADEAIEALKKLKVAIPIVPSQNGTLTYTGSVLTPVWNDYDPDMLAIGGEKTATNAGTYSATFTPKDGYQWADGSLDAKTVSWRINKATVSVPSQSGTLTYTGSAQSPSWTNYTSGKLTIGGTTSGTNAGSYNATFTPTSNYQWSDGSLDAKTVSWQIGRAVASVPVQSGTLTYTGSVQSPSWTNYTSDKLAIGGMTTGTNAGSYNATFITTSNYQWPDGSLDAKTVSWRINKATVSVPSQSGTLTYTGSAQSPSWTNYTSGKLTIGGTTSGTNAGSYNATFTPTSNYQWADGSTSAKTVAWAIGKAAGSLSINLTSITLDNDTTSKNIIVTRAGDGVITATSSNTDVVEIGMNGATITVNARESGTATVTIRVYEGTNHKAPSSKTVNVSVNCPKIYGVSWDGTSTTKWTRTDRAARFTDPVPYVEGATKYSSPFDDLQPWAGMEKTYRSSCGTMVAIPKFWYKLAKNGAGLKIQIASEPVSGFSVSPAHMNRGDGEGERDVVYIGRYFCNESTNRSTSGYKPRVGLTRANARGNIHNLGPHIWQMDFALLFTIWLLYLVEFADWNSQDKIGYGCGDGKAVCAVGYTDSMPYHTGTIMTSRKTKGFGTQYRNIEGLWDNVNCWCDGCYQNEEGFKIILNPSKFSDSNDGVSVGIPTTGIPSAFAVDSTAGFPVFIPTASDGTTDTYACDIWYFHQNYPCVYIGNYYSGNAQSGLFGINYDSATNTSLQRGSRLQELP